MGTNVSVDKIKFITEYKQPDLVVSYLPPARPENIRMAEDYAALNNSKTLFITGSNETYIQKGSSLKCMSYADHHESVEAFM